MSRERTSRTNQELKSEIMDRIEDEVDRYFESFAEKSDDGKSLPTVDQIEDMMTRLISETRDIYLDAISDSISNCDEADIIESKKENTEKEG